MQTRFVLFCMYTPATLAFSTSHIYHEPLLTSSTFPCHHYSSFSLGLGSSPPGSLSLKSRGTLWPFCWAMRSASESASCWYPWYVSQSLAQNSLIISTSDCLKKEHHWYSREKSKKSLFVLINYPFTIDDS